MQDRNFDDLAEKFAKNIYGTLKGQIRQMILWEELDALISTLPDRPLRILDAGGGIGQIACGLAQRGHQIVLCDLSQEMLRLAEENAVKQGAQQNIRFLHTSIQQVAEYLDKPIDLVLFHAVLEWVVSPKEVLNSLYQVLTSQGALSLMFYNLHGLTMQNLTLGNFGYLRAQMKKRKKRTLSPDYPRDPMLVNQWLEECGFVIERRAGIRVFSDYLRELPPSANGEAGIMEMERCYARQEPFINFGRYIHVTARKPL